jgi:hypothetical protein
MIKGHLFCGEEYWDFNSGLHACKAGAVPLEPYLYCSSFFKNCGENT